MSAPPIIQYWNDEVIPDYIEDLVASFPEHNPDYRHLVFHESTAERFISEHFGSREVEAFRACAVPAMQADYFRYCAVYALGGIYCDADCRCLGPLWPLLEPGGGEVFVGPEEDRAHNEILAFRAPGHPLLHLLIDISTANIESRISESVALVTGPAVLRILIECRRRSVEAWLECARGVRLPRITVNPERWHRHVDLLGTILHGDAQIARAFDGVRVSPVAKMRSLVDHGGSHLPYKHSEDHYLNVKSSIYRQPVTRDR